MPAGARVKLEEAELREGEYATVSIRASPTAEVEAALVPAEAEAQAEAAVPAKAPRKNLLRSSIAMLPNLIERAGTGVHTGGSITATHTLQ